MELNLVVAMFLKKKKKNLVVAITNCSKIKLQNHILLTGSRESIATASSDLGMKIG